MRAISLVELARSAPGWKVVIEFKRSWDQERDLSYLSQRLPWLWRTESVSLMLSDLTTHGIAIVLCDSEVKPQELISAIRGTRIALTVYTPSGLPSTLTRSSAPC